MQEILDLLKIIFLYPWAIHAIVGGRPRAPTRGDTSWTYDEKGVASGDDLTLANALSEHARMARERDYYAANDGGRRAGSGGNKVFNKVLSAYSGLVRFAHAGKKKHGFNYTRSLLNSFSKVALLLYVAC